MTRAGDRGRKSGKFAAGDARAARLAAALRENLRRRKAQARARKAGKPEPGAPKPPTDGG